MKKRLLALLLCLMMLLPTLAHAGGLRVPLKMRLATRTGPSTNYTELGSYFQEGDYVTAISRAYDDRNGIWWVQVEYSYRGEMYRAYTGHKRVSVNLYDLPQDSSYGYYSTYQALLPLTGPGSRFAAVSATLPAGASGEVFGYENGYVQLEYYDTARSQYCRVWLPADQVYDSRGVSFSRIYSGSWGVTWPEEEEDPGATLLPPANDPEQWTAPQLSGAVYGLGDTSPVIFWVQVQLKTLGFYQGYGSNGMDNYDATGYLGELTEEAIHAFQRYAGLSETGLVSQTLVDTIRMLQRRAGVSQTPIYTGGCYALLDGKYQTTLYPGDDRPEEIRLLQQLLSRLGYSVGSIDGRLGSRTMAAFQDWQTDAGFVRTSSVKYGHMYTLLEDYVSAGFSTADLR